MKVYISGPMTGFPQFNVPAFDAAAAALRARGIEVVSPPELDSADDPELGRRVRASMDGDCIRLEQETGKSWGDLLARDVKLIADGNFDAILVLDGWEKSRGAKLEVFTGVLAGVPIVSYKLQITIPTEDVMQAIWMNVVEGR